MVFYMIWIGMITISHVIQVVVINLLIFLWGGQMKSRTIHFVEFCRHKNLNSNAIFKGERVQLDGAENMNISQY